MTPALPSSASYAIMFNFRNEALVYQSLNIQRIPPRYLSFPFNNSYLSIQPLLFCHGSPPYFMKTCDWSASTLASNVIVGFLQCEKFHTTTCIVIKNIFIIFCKVVNHRMITSYCASFFKRQFSESLNSLLIASDQGMYDSQVSSVMAR